MSSSFIKELPELVRHNIISEEVSENISRYYKEKEGSSPNRLFVVFGVLGAILIGMGILLILAHNWDDFPRLLKTSIAFIPLVIGQLAVGFTILKKRGVAWKEASCSFLFFGIGISMALVSQIYNIPGNFNSYLLVWMLLSIPLVYLMKSNVLALFHVVFVTYYACNVGYFNNGTSPWLYIPLLLAVVPYYLMLFKKEEAKNTVAILHWLFPLSIIIVTGAFIETQWGLMPLIYVLLYGLIYNIGSLSVFKKERLRRNGYLILGSLGMVKMMLIMSFNDLWKELPLDILFTTQEFVIATVLFALSLGLLVYSILKHKKIETNLFRYVFIIFGILFSVGIESSGIATIGVNIVVFVLGLNAIKKGADQQHFGILNYGLLMIAMLIICRFFDTDLSFVIRGVLFVAIGVGFFLTNYMMLKQKKQKVNVLNNEYEK